MKINLVFLLIIIAQCTGLATSGTCGMTEFRKQMIKHRANVGGDCEDRNHCVGIIGNKIYNYQKIKHHEKLSLKDMDDVEKGNWTINREGVKIDETTREKFGLNDSDVKNVRSVHQYIEIKREIKSPLDGSEVELGYIDNKNNRRIREIENIVNTKGIRGAEGHVGQVRLKKGRMEQVRTSVAIDGTTDTRNRQVLSIGGVVIDNGSVSHGMKSNVFVKGR